MGEPEAVGNEWAEGDAPVSRPRTPAQLLTSPESEATMVAKRREKASWPAPCHLGLGWGATDAWHTCSTTAARLVRLAGEPVLLRSKGWPMLDDVGRSCRQFQFANVRTKAETGQVCRVLPI